MARTREKRYAPNGTPTEAGQARFWRQVNKSGPLCERLGTRCWEWTGYTFSDGYGGFCDNYWMSRAHRYSWLLANGPIPDGLHVLHKCDNPLCVRPDHLFIGTEMENKHDCMAKGRHVRGAKHACAKLTDEAVREIRALYRPGVRGGGSVSLARRFGVSKPVILGILKGRLWKHVS